MTNDYELILDIVILVFIVLFYFFVWRYMAFLHKRLNNQGELIMKIIESINGKNVAFARKIIEHLKDKRTNGTLTADETATIMHAEEALERYGREKNATTADN